jgi:hypothetical protein
MYKQCDGRWGGQELGTCAGDTICRSGCALSSVAMMLASRGVAIDPGSLDSWLTQHGGYSGGCNIAWGAVNAFGRATFIAIQTVNEGDICNGLGQGHGAYFGRGLFVLIFVVVMRGCRWCWRIHCRLGLALS